MTAVDVDRFFSEVSAVANRRGFAVSQLGYIDDDPILHVRRSPGDCPTVMVAAGFHGEEPAGCWGVLRYLETVASDALERVNLTVLPMVNPFGIRRGQRCSRTGNPNRGYGIEGEVERSDEARCLIQHIDLLRSHARDGFLSLHEDIDEDRFYVYTFETGPGPGRFSRTLCEVEGRHFAPVDDGHVEGNLVRDGVLFGIRDGSFEHWLFDLGVPYTACTETPGRALFEVRVTANADIVAAFVDFFAQEGTR